MPYLSQCTIQWCSVYSWLSCLKYNSCMGSTWILLLPKFPCIVSTTTNLTWCIHRRPWVLKGRALFGLSWSWHTFYILDWPDTWCQQINLSNSVVPVCLLDLGHKNYSPGMSKVFTSLFSYGPITNVTKSPSKDTVGEDALSSSLKYLCFLLMSAHIHPLIFQSHVSFTRSMG